MTAFIFHRTDPVRNKRYLTIAVSRLEGAVYHGLPEPQRAVSDQ